MKRLLIVATLAIMAAGCQKTFVQDEVQTPIGFSTEVGKQTRAIADADNKATYFQSQPFGVFAHAYQNDVFTNTVMNNIEISYQSSDYKATGTTKYYWPNDPRTELDFYAYSPAHGTSNGTQNLESDKVLSSGTIAHSRTLGLSLTNYVHTNPYVDFMVATPVKDATYTNQVVGVGNEAKNGCVALSFHHQMTQVVFDIKTSQEYTGVTFTVNSVRFNKILNTANFSQDYIDNYGAWTPQSPTQSYNVFPVNSETATPATTTGFSTTPVTMIPQDLTGTSENTSDGIIANGGQSFTIEYTISGTGVASETVVKTFEFADATSAPDAWEPNKKITYTLTIGLNEITFSPSVVDWSPDSGEFDI